jgi:SAM-dependent methyltransferase
VPRTSTFNDDRHRADAPPSPPHLRWQRALYPGYLRLATWLRSNRGVHRLLYGYAPCPGSDRFGAYWDWTTLVLRQALSRHLSAGMSLLDVGTGAVGVLALFAVLRLRCVHVLGVDIVPEVVAMARRQAAGLGVAVDFAVSDLFEAVKQRYDCVTFNAPYLSDAKAAALGLCKTPLLRQRFSGGPVGGEVIARLLMQLPGHLSTGGLALLGVNHFHIERAFLERLIAASPCRTQEIMTGGLTRSAVYVLRVAGTARGGHP